MQINFRYHRFLVKNLIIRKTGIIPVFPLQLIHINLKFFISIRIGKGDIGRRFGITFNSETKNETVVVFVVVIVVDGPVGGFITDTLPMLGISVSESVFVFAKGLNGVR